MSEFNPEFEQLRRKLISARVALSNSLEAKRYDEVLAEFQKKFPRAVIPAEGRL